MKMLKETVNLEGQKVDKMARSMNQTNSQHYLTPSLPTYDIPRLEGILSDLLKKAINLSSLNDTGAIIFSGLTLRSKIEGTS